jgi:hypothetical protein
VAYPFTGLFGGGQRELCDHGLDPKADGDVDDTTTTRSSESKSKPDKMTSEMVYIWLLIWLAFTTFRLTNPSPLFISFRISLYN